MPEGTRGRYRLPAALAAAAVSMALGIAWLARRQPEEDAYILFRYAEMAAGGHGIVFYPGGPRVEGATPFLWFVALAGLTRLGIDVAAASALLSSAAAGLLAWLLVGTLPTDSRGFSGRLWSALAVGWVCLGPPALASYGGFSTLAFSAVVVAGLPLLLDGGRRGLAFLPLYALALGLLRPEGVVVGAGYVLLALPRAVREGHLRPYLAALAVAVAIGASYLLWKHHYFGRLLPTSALVKSHASAATGAVGSLPEPLASMLSAFPGLGSNLRWFSKATGGWPPLLALVVLAGVLRRRDPATVRRHLFALAPAGLLLLVLLLAEQTQNLHQRFQAPVLACMVYLVWRLAARVHDRDGIGERQRRILAALCALMLAPTLVRGLRVMWRNLANPQAIYAASAGPGLGRVMRAEHRFALTEAGVLAFFSPARILDVVGLNDPQLAAAPPSVAVLRAFDPDVIMCHQSYVLDVGLLPGDETPRLTPLTRETLEDAVLPRHRWLFDGELTDYEGTPASPIHAAAAVIMRFMVESENYDLYTTGGASGALHIWGVRRSLPARERIVDELRNAIAAVEHPSYFDVRE